MPSAVLWFNIDRIPGSQINVDEQIEDGLVMYVFRSFDVCYAYMVQVGQVTGLIDDLSVSMGLRCLSHCSPQRTTADNYFYPVQGFLLRQLQASPLHIVIMAFC